jgi:hypothetical protein
MSKSSSPWEDGRRAWERLGRWRQDVPSSPSGDPTPPDDGTQALEALADIGHVRHLLDQAELGAVRAARRHNKSWTEIATRLGVTRQSAWERWRDLDEPAAAESSAGDDPRPEPGRAPDEVIERAARQLRRRSSVKVPNVIGQTWDQALDALRGKRLVGIGPDPDGPPLAALAWPGGVVTDQSPESGARVPSGSPVRLWVERGGGSAGDREPRRPKPSPKSAHEERYDPSDEAVG